ncbi:hypothetical protein GOZ80_07945 [Agrobacterium vitis]|uniref:Uncharacterized protein n=1 Tax=Agrobacterium vitis TaxID=373 RepID=A0ABD6G5F2_AGRVI|nr:hypothetical protein [Agrobacterium vitis]MUO79722.1 hypothetical protein [Agrobacterium vitis]MUO93789.1 hypothetical protein [Agrobacterium vitis]MUP03960.1 hypothetical protein [Agrobacterium vitis]MVA91953.1 hypothetical protein [Agrobacterium vitis]MVB01478.1 hypothetical protein [Agrobacterium vitis]
MSASRVRDPLLADDIALLQQIFDEVCDGHRIPKTSEDAEALALILVQQMQKGRRDKQTLRLVVDNIVEER